MIYGKKISFFFSFLFFFISFRYLILLTPPLLGEAMSKQGLAGSAHTAGDRYRRRLLAAAGLSNNLLFSNLNTTITIKSSPPKTAEETARLGIVSGFLTKRNEQHSWQRRFCTLVPHSLLYYFEDDDADAPRGIIDLEYYTDITAEPKHVVRLSTPPDAPPPGGQQRTFYFQADSEEEMNAWMSALIRERYFVLRDERDAYQELQHDFQAQTDDMASVMRAVIKENVAMDDVQQRVEREETEIKAQVTELVTSVSGESSGDATPHLSPAAFQRLAEAGKTLIDRVVDLENRLVESKRGAARVDRELLAYQAQVMQLTSALDDEQKTLAAEQKAKQTSMADVEALRRELDEAEVNLGIIERTKEASEGRVAELQDQKKLLVREVKAARKTLAEKQDDLAALREQKVRHPSRDSISPTPEDNKPVVPLASSGTPGLGTTTPAAPQTTTRASAYLSAISSGAAWTTTTTTTTDDDDVDDDTSSRSSKTAKDSPLAASTSEKTSFGGAVRAFLEDHVHTKQTTRKKPTLSAADDAAPAPPEKPETLPESPSRFVLRCKRCGGTVEGPKNSTCHCKEPLLTDEPTPQKSDLSSMFKSFFGSPVATKKTLPGPTYTSFNDVAQQQLQQQQQAEEEEQKKEDAPSPAAAAETDETSSPEELPTEATSPSSEETDSIQPQEDSSPKDDVEAAKEPTMDPPPVETSSETPPPTPPASPSNSTKRLVQL